MQRTSDNIWISFGAQDGHHLYPATISGPTDAAGATTCRFDPAHDPASLLNEQHGAVVYFHGPGGFLQQPVTIARERDGNNDGITLRFEPTRIPALAEERSIQRIGVGRYGLSAVVCGDDVCPVDDISTRGLSITSNHTYEMGQILEIAFEVPGSNEISRGYCRVRSIKTRGTINRYGLVTLNGNEHGHLERGLSAMLQWVQLSQTKGLNKAG